MLARMLTESLSFPHQMKAKITEIVGRRVHVRAEIQTEESVLLSTRQHDMSTFAFVPALNAISKAV